MTIMGTFIYYTLVLLEPNSLSGGPKFGFGPNRQRHTCIHMACMQLHTETLKAACLGLGLGQAYRAGHTLSECAYWGCRKQTAGFAQLHTASVTSKVTFLYSLLFYPLLPGSPSHFPTSLLSPPPL